MTLVTLSVIVVVAVGVTALITTAVVTPTATTAPPAPVTPPAPHYSAAEQATAKKAVCDAFDAGASGSTGRGGVVLDGQLNVPVVLRTLNSVVIVRDQISPATPPDVADAANRYISTQSELTTAALANSPVDKLVNLTKTGNVAIDAFSDVCGLLR